jgi:hypothetical protein
MTSAARNGNHSRRQQPRTAVGVLLALIGTALVLASIVHFGVKIPLGFATVSDPFPGAAPAETVVAIVVMGGAATVLARRASATAFSLTAVLFAILATGYGLTVTIRSTRTGDVTYHLMILLALLCTLGLLLAPHTRRRS